MYECVVAEQTEKMNHSLQGSRLCLLDFKSILILSNKSKLVRSSISSLTATCSLCVF